MVPVGSCLRLLRTALLDVLLKAGPDPLQVLHLREIYAKELFQRQRLYDMTVRKSRHPQLNDYIHAVVQGLKVRSTKHSARGLDAW